ncbi:MAG: hypothetical protein LBE48_04550 [Methanomassiliicoccaceae archaeon]|jgi:hypothetical protein|nr:hypothetical protein [Methanomassiliicoccaceae archaeon]
MVRSTEDSSIDAKGMFRRRDPEDSSIDAKKLPLAAGFLLMIAGFLILTFALYSVVMAALGKASAFGLIGGILLMPFGVLLLTVGGIMVFVGSVSRLSGRRNRRLLY